MGFSFKIVLHSSNTYCCWNHLIYTLYSFTVFTQIISIIIFFPSPNLVVKRHNLRNYKHYIVSI